MSGISRAKRISLLLEKQKYHVCFANKFTKQIYHALLARHIPPPYNRAVTHRGAKPLTPTLEGISFYQPDEVGLHREETSSTKWISSAKRISLRACLASHFLLQKLHRTRSRYGVAFVYMRCSFIYKVRLFDYFYYHIKCFIQKAGVIVYPPS